MDSVCPTGGVDQSLAAVGLRGFRAEAFGCLGRRRDALFELVDGLLAAVVALTDPQVVIVGGTWGTWGVLQAVSDRSGRLPRSALVRAASVTSEPSLTGARHQALRDLRAVILTQGSARPDAGPASAG